MTNTTFTKDLENGKMFITREFRAEPTLVWQAWTQPELLDQWWAPKPWKARTKAMHFAEGGYWLYCMEGPEGEKSWGKASYTRIEAPKRFEAIDSFCDENGVENTDFPSTNWKTLFRQSPAGTVVEIDLTFASPEDMEKLAAMGFQEGFAAAHENLDALLQG